MPHFFTLSDHQWSWHVSVTHWPLASVKNCLQKWFSNANLGQFIRWFSCESDLGWKPMFPSQQWSRLWLGAIRHQAITWAIVDQDPCRHMASLGVSELKHEHVKSWLQRVIWFYKNLCLLILFQRFWIQFCWSNDIFVTDSNISMLSYTHQGISNHKQLACLFQQFVQANIKETSKLHLTGPLWVVPPVTGGFSSQSSVMWKLFPSHDIIISDLTSHLSLDIVTSYLISQE